MRKQISRVYHSAVDPLKAKSSPAFTEPVYLHVSSPQTGLQAQSVVDTGSALSVISKQLATKLGLTILPTQVNCHLAFGQQAKPTGQVDLSLLVGAQKILVTVSALVTNANEPALILGRDALSKLPISLTFDKSLLFARFKHISPKHDSPTHQPGEGIPFAGGTPA